MTKDDLFCAECIGIGLVKLTVYGKDPIPRFEHIQGSAEIILDDNDLYKLIDSLEKARRMKVTISS